MAKPTKGKFIVGSFGRNGGGLSVAANPVEHLTQAQANAEAERLALANKGTTFVVLEVKGSCASAAVNWN